MLNAYHNVTTETLITIKLQQDYFSVKHQLEISIVEFSLIHQGKKKLKNANYEASFGGQDVNEKHQINYC